MSDGLDSCRLCPAAMDNQAVMCFGNDLANGTGVADILNKHFWFELCRERDTSNFVCQPCWRKVNDFHQFYQSVLAMYQTRVKLELHYDPLIDIDQKLEITLREGVAADDDGEEESGMADDRDGNSEESEGDETIESAKYTFVPVPIEAEDQNEPNIQDLSKKERARRKMQKWRAEQAKLKGAKPRPAPLTTTERVRLHRERKRMKLMQSPEMAAASTETSSPSGHECPICKRIFKTAVYQRLHTIRKHSPDAGTSYKCIACVVNFRTKTAYEQHCTVEHSKPIPKVQCDECAKWMKNADTLLRHKADVHRPAPQICEHCGYVAPSIHALSAHLRQVHREAKHKCPECGKMLKRKQALREHMASHEGRDLYECQFCAATFRSKTKWYDHRQKEHAAEVRAAKLAEEQRNAAAVAATVGS